MSDLKVGDKVLLQSFDRERYPTYRNSLGEVLAISGNEAWVRWGNGFSIVSHVAGFVIIKDEEPAI